MDLYGGVCVQCYKEVGVIPRFEVGKYAITYNAVLPCISRHIISNSVIATEINMNKGETFFP